ncbi:hypothetical protein KXT41_25380 [Salmonella enterica subsp. enterica serovar Weltevreden]|nr:hypothetical protein [Salmonella enterica subsp. enterica serovar Weltevreden]
MKNGVIDMTVLRIKWAGFCPKCDSDELDVHTDKGTSQFLYAGDGVVCSECGKKGEIDCGNKRCPHANDHRNACTGSNEPGQEGSAYQAAPQQEVKAALKHGMQRYAGAMQKLSEGDK